MLISSCSPVIRPRTPNDELLLEGKWTDANSEYGLLERLQTEHELKKPKAISISCKGSSKGSPETNVV